MTSHCGWKLELWVVWAESETGWILVKFIFFAFVEFTILTISPRVLVIGGCWNEVETIW